MKCVARITLLLALLLPGFLSTQAQPFKPNQRPLPGTPSVDLPSVGSIQEFLALNPIRTSLRAQATPQPASPLTPIDLAHPRSAMIGSGAVRVLPTQDGPPSWIQGNLGRLDVPAGKGAGSAAIGSAAIEALQPLRRLLELDDPARDLVLNDVTTDALGYTHIRFDQVVGDVPVWASRLLVHVDRESRIYAVNGNYERSPRRVRDRVALSGDEAVRISAKLLQGEGRWNPPSAATMRMTGMEAPSVQPVFYPLDEGTFVRAWDVSIHPNIAERYQLIVDAATGEVLKRLAQHCTILHDPDLGKRIDALAADRESAPRAEKFAPRLGSFVGASATDLNGVNQQIRVYQEDNGTHYAIWDLPNLTSPISLPNIPSTGGAITMSANNTDDYNNPNHVTAPSNTWNDPAAVSAHWNMERAYNYYATTFQRQAIDNRDQSMLSVIHITEGGQPMENAFWNGRLMGYGDGGQVFSSLAGALDVAGHEMTHGVVEHTAALVYEFQPGALNESFADVFAAFIDSDDYLMGEDIIQPGWGSGLRDLLNPDSPDLNAQLRQPAHMDQFQNMDISQDNGGVHVNSGIPNRAAALLMEAIGRPTTQAIYYQALTNYLTPRSQFTDARQAVERAATDIHGAGSPELTAVQTAFDAVGIGGTGGGGGGGGGQGDPGDNGVDPVVGNEWLAFLLESDAVGLMDMTDPSQYFNLETNGAVTNAVTQLSTPSGGGSIWYIQKDGYLAFFDMESGDNNVFWNLSLQQEGDLWNVAIAPDETYAVLASTYASDPNLYIWDGVQTYTIPLKAATTQEGIFDESIVFPDVVAVSPNATYPRIAFDALRRITAGGEEIEFWSIFEIDVPSERIINLLGTQPEDINIGNIVYGKTDPDLVAYNVFDVTGGQVWVSSLETGETIMLDPPGITDEARPSFSPDDLKLIFTSAANKQLVFFDSADQSYSQITFDQVVSHPHWFAVGTPSTAVEVAELPSQIRLNPAYPNPFNPRTSVSFDLDRSLVATLTVYDAIGREVARLQEGMLPSGTHSFTWNAESMPSGAYLFRLEVGTQVETRSVVLLK